MIYSMQKIRALSIFYCFKFGPVLGSQVLKMENCIDVRQDSPYGNILLLESSELKQISEY